MPPKDKLPATTERNHAVAVLEDVIARNQQLMPIEAIVQDERANEIVVRHLRSISSAERRRIIKKLRRVARKLQAEVKSNESRATLSRTIGTVVGGALATGSVLALASNPFAWPFVGLAVVGSGTTIAGLGIGHQIDKITISQELSITLIEDLLEDAVEEEIGV